MSSITFKYRFVQKSCEMEKDIPEVRKDIHYYEKVRDFIALEEREKVRLAKEMFSKEDYLDLRLDDVVHIINQTSDKTYGKEDDWSEWIV